MKEWLVADTWPIATHKTYSDLLGHGLGGICLVTKADAMKAQKDLEHCEEPCAVLAPCPIQGKGARMNVLVEL